MEQDKKLSKKEIAKLEEKSLLNKIKIILINHNIQVFNRKAEKEKKHLHEKGKAPQQTMTDEQAEEQVYELFWKAKKNKPILITIFKWILIIGLFFTLAYYWTYVQSHIINLLGKNPVIWKVYQSIMWHVSERTLLGLFYFGFFANLFFLSLPDEIVYIMYLSLGFPILDVIIVMILANVAGMIINYLAGMLISRKLIKKILKHKYTEYSIKMKRNGWLIILVGNIFPSPIQIVSVMFGSMRYGFFKFLLYTTIGKICKFTAIFYGYSYYMSMLSPTIHQSMDPMRECLKECINQTNISDIFTR